MTTFRAAIVLAATLLATTPLSGCALLTKSKPIDIRYFTPEIEARAEAPAAATGLQLRLGRVTAASYLNERIAYREPAAEIGYYTKLRWAEPPEAFLRRALSRRLFQDSGVREIVSGTGPSLEVDLEAFEERRADPPVARVRVTWRLRDQRTVIVQRTVTVEKPLAAGDPDDAAHTLVAAMGQALDSVVGSVTTEVIAALPAPPPPAAPATADAAAR
jgi:ABC-type uncharacterized transport system auxiliary subunit